MRSYDRYRHGQTILSARRLNDEAAERRRLAKITTDKQSIALTYSSTGIHFRAIAPPPSTIIVKNVGTATIPAMGIVELSTYHDTANSWDGQVPRSPGLTLVAVSVSDIAAGSSGAAYARGWNIQVLCPTNSTANLKWWLTTQSGTAVAQVVTAITGLKVLGFPEAVPPPSPFFCYTAFGSLLS